MEINAGVTLAINASFSFNVGIFVLEIMANELAMKTNQINV